MSESGLTDRLDRLEQKIDKLTDAMVSLARTEEKLLSLEAEKKNMLERLNRHSEKIDSMNDKINENTRITSTISKITWILATAAIGALLTGLKVLIGG